MQLSFKEAKKLSEAFTSVYAAYSALEDVRASGGFSEYVDEKRECKHCGAPTSEHVELAAKTDNSAVDAILPPFEEMWKRVQEYPEWSAHLSSINRTMDCECFYDLICRQLREGARTEGEIIKK